jgi:hypothetical protein
MLTGPLVIAKTLEIGRASRSWRVGFKVEIITPRSPRRRRRQTKQAKARKARRLGSWSGSAKWCWISRNARSAAAR